MKVGAVSAPTVASVVRELIERKLLTESDLVDRGVVAIDCSMSHRSFRLHIGDRRRLFVKRADPVGSQGRDITTEAAVYRLAAANPRLASVVPPCRVVSDDDTLVVLDDVDAPPLTAEAVASGWGGLGWRTASTPLDAYGRAVSRVHQVRPPPIGEPPWFLTALDHRWGTYDWLPPASRDALLRVMSSAGLRQAFGQAASRWRPSSLIHGDLRWSNVLVATDARNPRLWLVDWELACLGDPAWDVGSVIGDLVTAPLAAPTLGSSYDPMIPVSRFLEAYRNESSADARGFVAFVERSAAFAGIRLVQTLVEYGYAGAVEVSAVEPFLRPWIDVFLGDPARLGGWLAAGETPIKRGTG